MSRLYSVIFGSSWGPVNTEAGGKSAYINVQDGGGAPTQRNTFSLEISISYA
ncbi:Uncharacterised protein [Staphylococcus aureus]|nr:Uncharacterised protein [Staphylococcus aureus]